MRVPPPWSTEQVLALAPDASSAKAGRSLAGPHRWRDTGVSDDPALLWGECLGSGSKPYQTVVDLSGPAYKCSCPSRKFPCKHTLGLLLLWAEGKASSGGPPEWAAGWQNARVARTEKATARAERDGPVDAAAARRRTEERASRVESGLDELDRWLADQVRTGLSGVERGGYGVFEQIAARMVDAQAPATASTLRRLATVAVSGEGWPARLLEEYALLHLAIAGHRRLSELPADLAATVRTQIGYSVSRADVLATPPVHDTWAVLGLREITEDRVKARRLWLRGESTGRSALVLNFATAGGPVDATVVPGARIDAGLHFYPGAHPLRALVGEQHRNLGPFAVLSGQCVSDALAQYAEAVTANPWTEAWPMVLDGIVAVSEQDTWWLVDQSGGALPVASDSANTIAMWRLLAVSGGHPVTVAAEYSPRGLWPLSALDAGRLVLL